MTGSNGAFASESTPHETYTRLTSQPENPFATLIPDQSIAVIPEFLLECGATIYNVPIAYKTYGTLTEAGDNALVVCHALTGSADVGDWWGPLMGGAGKAFDISRFFVVCMNSLGSPYGSASPVTRREGEEGDQIHYGPEFPLTTIRDDVNIFKLLLDDLGVKQIAAVIGGSMGGMLVLEFAYFGKDYVRSIVAIATSPRYSAWGISWGEAQRQSIYSDPKYEDGYYPFADPPSSGLAAARMSALLTYRSRDSFESRFGRNIPDPSRRQNINGSSRPHTPSNEHFAIHNDGHKRAGGPRPSRINSQGDLTSSIDSLRSTSSNTTPQPLYDPQFSGTTSLALPATNRTTPHYFSAQSYLRYQGEKFIKRFDANCYIAITRKLDTHDVSRGRVESAAGEDPVPAALAQIKQPTLVLGIESDGLFTFAEQKLLAQHIPDATLEKIDSPEGHDAFLLEFEQVNAFILAFEQRVLPDIMTREPTETVEDAVETLSKQGGVVKNSTFGEAEVEDITAW